MRKINYQVLLEIIVILLVIATISYLLISGKYKIFVAKQITYWLVFMIVVTIAWLVGNLYFIHKPKYNYGFKHNLVLLLPIVAIYGCVQATDFNQVGLPPPSKETTSVTAVTSNIEQKDLVADKSSTVIEKDSKDNKSNLPPVIDKSTSPRKSTSQVSPSSNANNEEEIPEPWYEIDHKKKIIVLNTDNYYDSILEVTAKLKKYMGYKMVIEGFVTRNDQYYDNGDFMIARMAMTCCSADIAPVGVVAFYPRGQNLPDNTWVRAEGIIVPHDFLGLPQIAIRIKSIQKIEPIPGYVYPQ